VEQTDLHLFTKQQANKMASQTDREENLKCPQIPPISAQLLYYYFITSTSWKSSDRISHSNIPRSLPQL